MKAKGHGSTILFVVLSLQSTACQLFLVPNGIDVSPPTTQAPHELTCLTGTINANHSNKSVKLLRKWEYIRRIDCHGKIASEGYEETQAARDDVFLPEYPQEFAKDHPKLTAKNQMTCAETTIMDQGALKAKLWIDVAPNTLYGSFHVENGENLIDYTFSTCIEWNAKTEACSSWKIIDQASLVLDIDYSQIWQDGIVEIKDPPCP